MGWLVTLGILGLLAVLPLGVSVRYNDRGPLVKAVAGPIRITLFPVPKKKGKKKKKPAPQSVPAQPEVGEEPLPKPPQPPKAPEEKTSGQEKGGSLLDFLPLVKLAFGFLGDFRRKLRVRQLRLKLILGGGDPCDLAVNYGKTWAAMGNLIPKLESWFVIQKREVEVECDFTASQTLVIAHAELTITLGRLLSLLAVYGIRVLKEYLQIQKKRKGGAVT